VNIRLKTKLLIIVLGLLVTIPFLGIGCQEEVALPPAPSPSELSRTLVPNVPLDAYLYAKQSRPTTIPANMVRTSQDINIEALAVWGVPSADDFAFGMALILTSTSEASTVYDRITSEKDVWKKLSGNTIYLVQGSGLAAESLKAAISNNDFKYYDDNESLQAVAFLPTGGATKMAAVATAKPSKALIDFAIKTADVQAFVGMNTILNLMDLKMVAGGLYSPHEIDVAEIALAIDKGGSIQNLDLGFLVLVKSGLPSFVVEPFVKYFLTKNEFTETNIEELTLYKGSLDIDGRETIPALVRIEGNNIFIAISGMESYAKTLITSIQIEQERDS